MKPREFTNHNLITFPFTQSRVTELAVVLRSAGLFPISHKHDYNTAVSINQAALFLYLLASDTPVKHVKGNIEILTNLHDSKGNNFFQKFCQILADPEKLKKVKNIEIGNQIRFCSINYSDGKSENYVQGVSGATGGGLSVTNLIQKFCRIPFSFLSEFCINLFSEEVNYTSISPENMIDQLERSFRLAKSNVFDESPSLHNLQESVRNWDN